MVFALDVSTKITMEKKVKLLQSFLMTKMYIDSVREA